VKLHESGWWDNAIKDLLLTVVWASGKEMVLSEIISEVEMLFGLNLDRRAAEKIVEELRSENILLKLPDDKFKLSERENRRLDSLMIKAESSDKEVKAKFRDSLEKNCPAINHEECWERFNDKFLFPTVKQIGARTYELISGTTIELNRMSHFSRFTEEYDKNLRESLKNAIVNFMDPEDEHVREYILRNLNSYFLLEACNLSEKNLDTLSEAINKKTTFQIFVDTNFLFSILELHENPFNEAASSLMEVLRNLGKNVNVELYVFPLTIFEVKFVIKQTHDFMKKIRFTPTIIKALPEKYVSGLMMKFAKESEKAGCTLDVTDYFKPYLENLKEVIKRSGLKIYNTKYENYLSDDRVLDDVKEQREYESRKYGTQAKSEEQLKHDLILWHFVNDLRPVVAESPIEARYWIVTVDFRFIRFDIYKERSNASLLPVCVDPASLVQMLQFWVPRNKALEKTILENLKLPCLFHEFAPASEKVTIRILQTLSRYENLDDLSEESITGVLLNEALRQRIEEVRTEEEQVELVKEAIIDENKKIADEKKEKEKQLEKEEVAHLKTKDEADKEISAKDKEMEKLQESISLEAERVRHAELQVQKEKEMRTEAERKYKKEAQERKNLDRRFKTLKILSGLLIALVLVVLFELFIHKLPWAWLVEHNKSYSIQIAICLAIVTLVAGLIHKPWLKTCLKLLLIPLLILIVSLLGGPKEKERQSTNQAKTIKEIQEIKKIPTRDALEGILKQHRRDQYHSLLEKLPSIYESLHKKFSTMRINEETSKENAEKLTNFFLTKGEDEVEPISFRSKMSPQPNVSLFVWVENYEKEKVDKALETKKVNTRIGRFVYDIIENTILAYLGFPDPGNDPNQKNYKDFTISDLRKEFIDNAIEEVYTEKLPNEFDFKMLEVYEQERKERVKSIK
jgi:hypothetical protein